MIRFQPYSLRGLGSLLCLFACLLFGWTPLQAQFDGQAQFDTLTYEAGVFEIMLTNLPPSTGCGFSRAGVSVSIPATNTQNTYFPVENDDLEFPDPDDFNIRLTNIYELYQIKVHIRHANDPNASFTNFPNVGFEDSVGFSRNNPDALQVFEGTIGMRPQKLTLAIGPNDNYAARLESAISTRYYDPSVFTQVDGQITISIPIMVQGISPNVEPRGVTVMPQVPFMVLHDPPGDESFSEVSSSYSTCQEYGQSFQLDNQNSVRASVKLGGGVPGFFEAYGSLEAGFTFGVNNTTNTTNEVCVQTNKAFSTSAGDEILGDDADIFIGSGPTIAYGVANTLFYNKQSCMPEVRKTLTFSPTGNKREFILTAAGIRQDIETLQQLIASNPSDTIRVRAQNQIDVWQQVLAKNASNKANSSFIDERTIDGGATVTESVEVSSTTTQSIETKILIGADVAAEVSAGGLGVEVSGRVEVSVNTEFGNSTTVGTTQTRSVGFTLADGEADNRLNVRVGRDPMYGTPVFSLQSGSRSSCPYEAGAGIFQLDQPKLSANINNVETKTVVLNNVPNNTAVSFRLNICNDSDVPREYFLKLASSSNVNGAQISVAGTALNNTDNGVAFVVPAGGCFTNGGIRPLINISQSDTNLLNYPNLKLFLYPICEGNTLGDLSIVDIIEVSVNYVENLDQCANDTQSPVFTSTLPDQTVNINPGFCGQAVVFDPPVASDNCTVTVTQTAGPASGANFFPGTTTVTFEARDAAGNAATTSFNVTVIDNEPPSFTTSQADITMNVNPGFCSELVFFNTPEVFDNCFATVAQVAGPASGENFFPGTTVVTFRATDNSGNTTDMSFNVTIIDNEAPVISNCPSVIEVITATDACSANVNWTPPAASDNCIVASSWASAEPGTLFEVGRDTVQYLFEDNAGNISSCSFELIVLPGDSAFCAGTVGIGGIRELDNKLSVYPNPGREMVTLSFEQSIQWSTDVEVYDLAGKRVIYQVDAIKSGEFSAQLSIQHLKAGVYYVKLSNQEGIRTQKLIVLD